MPRFLADENLEQAIVEEFFALIPTANMISVRDVGLEATDDQIILDWASTDGRIVVTRDVSTMKRYAENRVAEGLPMPGIVLVPFNASIGEIIETLANMALYSLPGEWEGQVLFAGSGQIA